MHIMYFTERPYRHVPNDEVIKNGFFGIPNKHFDSAKGSQLLNEYLDEKVLAEQLGFDGVMLNEHHDTAFCMGSVMNVEAAILARITERVKIVLLGNPLPVVGNPLRLAEELSMIDMISHGRLVAGWVRGAGSEQFATNANPGYNREYFNEAHELVVQAWTRPGPWRYEGKHFHYRFVDPWALPIQKPHPPIWIPGLLSPETVVWCAQHRYPYIALATFLEPTVELWNIYRDAAAKEGYQVGSENFGYLQKVFVAETEEKARDLAKWDMFGGAGIGYSLFGKPQWMFPPATIPRKRPGASRGNSRIRILRRAVRLPTRLPAVVPTAPAWRNRKSIFAPGSGRSRRSTSKPPASKSSRPSRRWNVRCR